MDYLDNKKLSQSALYNLTEKVNFLMQVRNNIEEVEKELTELKETERGMSNEIIPALLAEVGLASISLIDGSVIEVVEEIKVKLPSRDIRKRKKVLDFIAANGGEGIIKDTIMINNPDVNLFALLEKNNIGYARKKDVHPQTLKAFFKEITGNGKNTIKRVDFDDIPEEANFFIYKKTKIIS
jgi:hypothetical protein